MRQISGLLLTLVCVFSAAGAPADLAAGRGADETPAAVATGPSGWVYVAGLARGRDRGIYVARIEPTGTKRGYTAHLGGSGEDVVKAIAVDRYGNAYIVGHTNSADFPVFGAEAKPTGGTDVFLAKIDAKGNWLYSTLLGGRGNDAAQAVAVDGNGDVYVTGWTASADFPADGERLGEVSGFVVKLRAGARVFGRFFSGGERTAGNGIAVDWEGAMYIAGSQEARGRSEAFLLKLNNRGEQVYRRVLQGNGDQAAMSVALAEDGVAWVGGWTSSSDFPVNRSGESGGGRDAFVARFDAEGTRTFSKVVGGKADDEAHELALDSKGNVYLAGITRSQDFPTLDAARAGVAGGVRSFAVKLSADGERVYHSEPVASALAGSRVRMAVDTLGNAILTGNARVSSVATCRYRLSKALHSFDTGGGDASILVDAPEECGWIAESGSAWIAVARLGDRFEVRAAPNDSGGPRAGTVVAGGQTLMILQAGKGDWSRSAITGAIRSNAGFQTTPIPACDDCSSAAVPLGFSINFFGTTYTQVYVNNNGNVSFGSNNGTYTATAISSVAKVLIAPFWADVDTTGTGSGLTRYGTDVVNGRPAFGVNWVDVGYYSGRTDKLNSMQLVLINRGDLGVGFFDIEMNYASIQWETGNASGGTNGLGGSSARAGFSNGSATAGTFFELPGSAVPGAFLNGGSNSLAANSSNSGGVAGRYVYNVRAGSVVCGTGITPTSASVGTGGGPVTVNVTASNAACTWNVTALPAWITVTSPAGGNGTGNGTVTLQVAANTGAARSAVITVAGQSFTVTQAGSGATPTCAPVSFAHGTDLSTMSGSLSQGSLAGLERLLDGSFTLHNFIGNTTNFTQTSTPQYQQSLTNCNGRPPVTPTLPLNYRLLSEQRGSSALNPMVTELGPTGTSSSVGVGAYSLDAAKMQVWNSTANKTPGTRATYDIPANPQKTLSADLNNDNKRDVVLISQGATGGTQGVLSSFPGNGDGTLGQRRDVNVGNNPQSAVLYDFDIDTRLDAAVANTGSNNVMFLKGNGDVSFQQPVTLAGDAAGPRAISAADLNKDGKGDLIIGHNNGVDVRLGNGNGTFQPPTRIASGFVATSVGSGDFNKDGNPDVAVSSETTSTAMIILGNGNGTFGAPASYVTRANAGPFFVSDFDGDGNSDMVFGAGHPDGLVAASGDSNVSVIYGRANGTLYGSSSTVLPSLGGFAAADFNGDGVPDVAATAPFIVTQASADRKAPTADTPNTAGLYLAINNGQGTLQPQNPIPVPAQAPSQLTKITAGDFNGDNRRDIAVTSGSNIHVLLGNGFGGFGAPSTFTGSSQMTSIAAADLNGDFRHDLIFTDDGEDKVSVALGNGNGTFQARTPMNAGVDPKGVVAADVNGDGRPDLIVVNFGTAGNDSIPGGISVLLGNGNGTFQSASNIAAGLHPTNVSVGDVNADGKPDLVVSTGGANAATLVAVLPGNGNGTFQSPSLLPVAFGPAETAITDFNGDGKVDIVVGHCCGEVQMGVLLGNGNGTFQTETGIPNTGRGSSYISVLDVNQDARADIVFGANTSTGAYVATLLNTTTTAAPVCTFGVSQNSYSLGTPAQTVTGTVTASAASCSFNAASSATWVTVSPTFGQGQTSTTFTLTVQANVGAQRIATVTIGGQSITVTQAGPACPFNLSPTTLSPPPAGNAYSIGVASSAGCAWSIAGVPSWVTVTSPASLNSSGSGTINLNVASNPGAARIANLTIAGQAFLITQAGTGPAGGLRFTAVEPCRLLETRAEYNFEGRTGDFGPPFFNAGQTRTLPLPSSSVCRTIPANAKAYVLNVTLVPRDPVDFVTVYPTGQTLPDFWTVRSLDGLIVANSAIVAAGTGGAINVYASNRTDIIIDISGYFTDDAVLSNLVYYPLSPCRVIETRFDYRPAPGPFGPPTMGARETRNFRFPVNGYCQVPTGAAAYAATITVVPPAPLAFLTAWPEGRPQPNVSSTNSPAGRIVANSVIVPASPDGGIQLFTLDRSDVIVDITGYFGPDDGTTGMFFFPVRQCRISQTNGVGFTGVYNGPIFADDTTRSIPIPTSTCAGIPGNARAYSLNATVMPGGSPMPFLTIYPSGQGRPNASVINAFEGQTVSSGFLVPAGINGAVDVYAYRRTHIALEISGYFGR